jgi:uncharacterized membrane protein YfcA
VNYKNKLVDVRAGVAIGIAAALVSYAGVALSVVLPTLLGNLLFAALMLYTALQFIVRALGARKDLDR